MYNKRSHRHHYNNLNSERPSLSNTYLGEPYYENNTTTISYMGERIEVDANDLYPSEPRYDDY